MRGTLIHYNAQSDQGLIRAEDGKRYAFHGRDWRAEYEPLVNDEVDFQIAGAIAYDIYLVGVTPAAATPLPAAPQRSPLAQRLFGDWTVVFAVLALLGCLLPFLTVGGAFNTRAQSANLAGVGSTIGQIIDLSRKVESLSRGFRNQRNLQRDAKNAEVLRWSLRIGYALYLVPLFALLLIAAKAWGLRARALAAVQGLSSVVLPVAVPLAFSAAIYAQIPPDARKLAQNFGGLFEVSFTGPGFWVMVLAGAAQVLALFGVLRKAPIQLFGARNAA
jgi:hypothetical protein